MKNKYCIVLGFNIDEDEGISLTIPVRKEVFKENQKWFKERLKSHYIVKSGEQFFMECYKVDETTFISFRYMGE
jgi:hypothetical protein|nr:MAG TPA: hypothetical protein [Caudoviricetes sp.]